MFRFDAIFEHLLLLANTCKLFICIQFETSLKELLRMSHIECKWEIYHNCSLIKTAHRVQHCFTPSHKIRWSGKVVDTWQIGQRQSKQPPILYHIVLLLASLRGICDVNLIYIFTYLTRRMYTIYTFIYE